MQSTTLDEIHGLQFTPLSIYSSRKCIVIVEIKLVLSAPYTRNKMSIFYYIVYRQIFSIWNVLWPPYPTGICCADITEHRSYVEPTSVCRLSVVLNAVASSAQTNWLYIDADTYRENVYYTRRRTCANVQACGQRVGTKRKPLFCRNRSKKKQQIYWTSKFIEQVVNYYYETWKNKYICNNYLFYMQLSIHNKILGLAQ